MRLVGEATYIDDGVQKGVGAVVDDGREGSDPVHAHAHCVREGAPPVHVPGRDAQPPVPAQHR